MKICTVEHSHIIGTAKKFGVLENNKTFINLQNVLKIKFEKENLYASSKKAKHLIPDSLFDYLNLTENPLAQILEIYEYWQKLKKAGDISTLSGHRVEVPLSQGLELRCPLDRIAIYRDFYAHEKHVATGFKKRNEPIPPAWYEIPAYYKGATAGFIGPNEDVHWPSYSEKLDYELELGVVIAQGGIDIKEKDACKNILGFTILNDISARDIQKKEMAIRLGPAKGKDFCSVMGPVITTIDEFSYKEPDLKMTAKINGEQWSLGQSGDAHYSFSQMIAHASMAEWITPGDFFGSGTVGTGCGLEIDKWLQPNDVIELEVENIGKLINKVIRK